MKEIDVLILLAVTIVVGAIILYLRKEKKKGKKCIGCSCCDGCSGNCAK